jgi:hypothetical protein
LFFPLLVLRGRLKLPEPRRVGKWNERESFYGQTTNYFLFYLRRVSENKVVVFNTYLYKETVSREIDEKNADRLDVKAVF